MGWRRTARLKEPQKLGPKPGQQLSPIHCPNLSPMLGPARRENRNRFSHPKNSCSPKLAPVLRPVFASLRLRCRSAGAARHPKDGRVCSQTSPAAILPDWPSANPAEYALLGGRATEFSAESICSRALRDSFSFGSPPKELNRFFRRGARLSYGRVLFSL